jgi:hypothetical protein
VGTKNNPGLHDCYAAAEGDEPIFVLLARDKSAPALVLAWAMERKRLIDAGSKPAEDLDKVGEAMACTHDMIRWQRHHRP